MVYDIAGALQPFNAMNAYAQGANLAREAKDNRSRNALMDMQLEEAQFQSKRRSFGKNSLPGGAQDGAAVPQRKNYLDAYMEDAAAAGDFEAYSQASDKLSAQSKARREEDSARLTGLKTHLDLQGQLLGGVRDQASYDAALYQAQRSGMDVTGLPQQFNPQTIASLRQMALTASQQVEQEWKQKGYGLDVAKFGYQQRNDAANRSVTIRGQNLTDARAAAQLTKPQLVETSSGYEWVRPGQSPQGAPKGVAAKGNESPENTIKVIEAAEKLIPDSTGSYGGAAYDIGARVFGKSTEGADNAARLKVLEAKLVQSMPKMSGPQSDRDVQLYREAAGLIGDPTLPNSQKLAAMETLREITKRHTPQSGSGSGATGGWGIKRID